MSQFYAEKLSVEDKLIKAKIHLHNKSPFYSYLVMHLKFERNDKIGSIGVDPDGNVFWNEEFMKGKTTDEVMMLLAHEVTHTTLRHHQRLKGRDKNLANIAMDTVTNQILIDNDFQMIRGGIIPRGNSIEFMGQTIRNIRQKIWEEIYDELAKAKNKQKGKSKKQADCNGEDEAGGDYQFDEHIPEVQKKNKDSESIKKPNSESGNQENHSGNSQETENKPEEISDKPEDINEKWNRIFTEAITRAKMHGGQTGGLDRYVDILLNPKKSWHSILQREITHESPVDYDWGYPSRRSHQLGIYLPSQKKENIELAIGIDSSGSIDDTELKTFVSKIWEITQGFRNINMTVLVCDDKIHTIKEFTNANLSDIKKLKLKGGGNTSFQPVIDWVGKNKPNVRLLIYLTDGIANRPNTKKFNGRILWVLSKQGTTENVKNTGNIIKMEE
jgi:predicted metal-dependent peptidase